jgi:hypothetical protein
MTIACRMFRLAFVVRPEQNGELAERKLLGFGDTTEVPNAR